MRYVISLILFALLPGPLFAGPWPRAAGERVLGFSLTGDVPSISAEVGLRNGRWASLKAEALDSDFYRLRFAMHQGFVWGNWALSFGLGGKLDHQRLEAWAPDGGYMASGISESYHLSVGRSLQWPIEGWVSADLRLDNDKVVREDQIEMTLGLKMRPDLTVLSQFTLKRQNKGDLYRRFSPSVIWHSSRGKDFELGLTHDLDGTKGSQVKLGTSFNF